MDAAVVLAPAEAPEEAADARSAPTVTTTCAVHDDACGHATASFAWSTCWTDAVPSFRLLATITAARRLARPRKPTVVAASVWSVAVATVPRL